MADETAPPQAAGARLKALAAWFTSFETSPPPAGSIRLWDLPTRIFHWSLVLLMILLYLTGERILFGTEVHIFLGKLTTALVLARIVWGFVGSETSRFSSFLKHPKEALAYVKAVRAGEHWNGVGHNPAGALMMLGLLALILVLAFTGLFAEDNEFLTDGGPFAKGAPEALVSIATFLHHNIFYLLLLGIAGHVGAAVFYKVVKKEDLIHPLVTGIRPHSEGIAQPSLASPALAAGIFAGSIVVVWTFVAVFS